MSAGGRREFTLFADREGIEESADTTDSAVGQPIGIDLTNCEFDNSIVVGGGTLAVDGDRYQVPYNGSHAIGDENVKMTLFAENR